MSIYIKNLFCKVLALYLILVVSDSYGAEGPDISDITDKIENKVESLFNFEDTDEEKGANPSFQFNNGLGSSNIQTAGEKAEDSSKKDEALFFKEENPNDLQNSENFAIDDSDKGKDLILKDVEEGKIDFDLKFENEEKLDEIKPLANPIIENKVVDKIPDQNVNQNQIINQSPSNLEEKQTPKIEQKPAKGEKLKPDFSKIIAPLPQKNNVDVTKNNKKNEVIDKKSTNPVITETTAPKSFKDKIADLFSSNPVESDKDKKAKEIKSPYITDLKKSDLKKNTKATTQTQQNKANAGTINKNDKNSVKNNQTTNVVDTAKEKSISDDKDQSQTSRAKRDSIASQRNGGPTAIPEMDSNYENKVFEYNKKPDSLDNYKIVDYVPEFLRKANDTLGNKHIKKIYTQRDYVRIAFQAIDDENIAAIDRAFIILKNTEIKNKSGDTPLIYAVRNNKVKAVRYLVKRGCNLDYNSKEGETPLALAMLNENQKISAILNGG